jgi:hypothetical protein
MRQGQLPLSSRRAVGLPAKLCPNAKDPDSHKQDDRPVKKQNTLPNRPLQTMFRNRWGAGSALAKKTKAS